MKNYTPYISPEKVVDAVHKIPWYIKVSLWCIFKPIELCMGLQSWWKRRG
jgi:hypothetical protein